MGILILTIHIVNLLMKKEKRKDEKSLLDFFVFTLVHFATYLTFAFVKTVYTSNAYIIAFYTAFYIMNNIEVFMLCKYVKNYVNSSGAAQKAIHIVNYVLFATFIVLDIVNVFTGIFFTAENGAYLRSKTMVLSQGYQFVMFVLIAIFTATNKNLTAREKTAFGLYCFTTLR